MFQWRKKSVRLELGRFRGHICEHLVYRRILGYVTDYALIRSISLFRLSRWEPFTDGCTVLLLKDIVSLLVRKYLTQGLLDTLLKLLLCLSPFLLLQNDFWQDSYLNQVVTTMLSLQVVASISLS
jgi:hypothetical protein